MQSSNYFEKVSCCNSNIELGLSLASLHLLLLFLMRSWQIRPN